MSANRCLILSADHCVIDIDTRLFNNRHDIADSWWYFIAEVIKLTDRVFKILAGIKRAREMREALEDIGDIGWFLLLESTMTEYSLGRSQLTKSLNGFAEVIQLNWFCRVSGILDLGRLGLDFIRIIRCVLTIDRFSVERLCIRKS